MKKISLTFLISACFLAPTNLFAHDIPSMADEAVMAIRKLQTRASEVDKERETTQQKVTELTSELTTVAQARDTATAEVTRLNGELATVTQVKNGSELERDIVQTQLTEANIQVKLLDQQLAEEKTRFETEVTRLSEELATVAQARDTATAEVTKLSEELATVTQVKNGSELEREIVQKQLTEANIQVNLLVQQLTEEKTRFETEITRLSGELATVAQARDAATAEVTMLNGELATVAQVKNGSELEREIVQTQFMQANTQVTLLNQKLETATEKLSAIQKYLIETPPSTEGEEVPHEKYLLLTIKKLVNPETSEEAEIS